MHSGTNVEEAAMTVWCDEWKMTVQSLEREREFVDNAMMRKRGDSMCRLCRSGVMCWWELPENLHPPHTTSGSLDKRDERGD